MNYKNIPTEDWSKYPETEPKESGYYLTVYEDINLYYKCIYWCIERQDWISWRSPFSSKPHNFEVKGFVEKTRTDFYHPEKVDEIYS
jgi:hypothetical protein